MSQGDDVVKAFLKEFEAVTMGRVEQFRLGRMIDQAIYDNEEVYYPSGAISELVKDINSK